MCEHLEEADVPCWIATRDIDPGESYPAEIQRGLDSCCLLLLLYSQSVEDSPWVLREVESALRGKLRIIPVRLDETVLGRQYQYLLGVNQWIDVRPSDPRFYEIIISSCRRSVNRGTEPPTPVRRPSEPLEKVDNGTESHRAPSRLEAFLSRGTRAVWPWLGGTAIALVLGSFVVWKTLTPRTELKPQTPPSNSNPPTTSFSEPTDPLDQVIASAQYDQADIRDALRSMFKSSDVSYTIAPEVQGTVTANIKEKTLKEALSQLLDQVDATYRIEGGIFNVVKKSQSN